MPSGLPGRHQRQERSVDEKLPVSVLILFMNQHRVQITASDKPLENPRLIRPMDTSPSLELGITKPGVVFVGLQPLHLFALRNASRK